MADQLSLLLFLRMWAKWTRRFATEESVRRIRRNEIPPALQSVEIRRHKTAGRGTLQNMIHRVDKQHDWKGSFLRLQTTTNKSPSSTEGQAFLATVV